MKPSGCWSLSPALGVTESPPRTVETQLQREAFDLIPAVPGHVYSDQRIVSKLGKALEKICIRKFERIYLKLISVPCCLVTKSCPALCNPIDCIQCTRLLSSLSSPRVLLRLLFIELVILPNHLIFCCTLLLLHIFLVWSFQ